MESHHGQVGGSKNETCPSGLWGDDDSLVSIASHAVFDGTMPYKIPAGKARQATNPSRAFGCQAQAKKL
jgi:hypothetical protein